MPQRLDNLRAVAAQMSHERPGGLFRYSRWLMAVTLPLAIWVYSQYLGSWAEGVGLVSLIFVHELGHAVAMKQMGIRATAPVFIPFVGAFIAMRGRPRNAFVEAVVGIGGPLLGTLGAVVCVALWGATGGALWLTLAIWGFGLNLFNLIPISPLDGGRVAGAVSRWTWLLGFGLGAAFFATTRNPMVLVILALGAGSLLRLRRNPVPGYYDISAGRRVLIGAAYLGLVLFTAGSFLWLSHESASHWLAGLAVPGWLTLGALFHELGGETDLLPLASHRTKASPRSCARTASPERVARCAETASPRSGPKARENVDALEPSEPARVPLARCAETGRHEPTSVSRES